ncbi:CvpA family protein [Pelobium sp.]|nr:CvpA family protein [Pelobium sp.]MDA9555431.1 CvpA family protein [Pelobium sp.]
MFNYVDFTLAVIIVLSIYHGWRKGFIKGLSELIALAVSIWAAFSFYLYVATYLDDQFKIEERWLFPLSFFSTILVTRLIIGSFYYVLAKTTSNKIHQGTFNKSMGIIPGSIRGVLYATFFSLIFLFAPLWPGLSAKTRESEIATFLTQKIEFIDREIAPDVSEEIKQSISRLTIEPESDETVYLPYTVENPVINEKYEDQLLNLVNKERLKAGLSILKKDIEIREVARAHSIDMFKKGYFSHINLENKSPYDRMLQKHITYIIAGENLALAQTVEIAHEGLMNSPSHKANILNPKFGRVGIGIVDGGINGIMVTQDFRN